MKKILIGCLLILLLAGVYRLPIHAEENIDPSVPYYTYTMGPKGQMITTQTAYVPGGYLSLPVELKRPEDMVLFNNQLYVIDSGSLSVVMIDEDMNFLDAFTYDGFVSPKGIDVVS